MTKQLLLLAFAFFVGMSTATAQKIVDSGTCGIEGDDNYLTWTITDDGTLTISGTGFMTYCPCLYELRSQIRTVIIEDGITSIVSGAFSDCAGLQSISIPNSVTYIGSGVFNGTAIYNDENNWEAGVLYVDNCLIEAKRDITGACSIAAGTRLIANEAFGSCYDLQTVTMSEGVESIGTKAFSNCFSLQSITIPKGMISIWDLAFFSCFSLQSITIPNSVINIGDGTFFSCTSLRSVYVHHKQPISLFDTFVFYVFDHENRTLYVPVGSKAAYEAAPYWNEFNNIEEMDYNTGIPENSSIEAIVHVEGDRLVIQHVAVGTSVRVYTLSGALLQSLHVTAGSMELALPQAGVYLVQVGGTTHKVMI